VGWSIPPLGQTGGGQPSGGGFVGGYGFIARSAYATPASLDFKPWTLDFLVEGGALAYPTDDRINPFNFDPPLAWRTDDWDPGLRFWALPFDPRLTEWLQDLDLAAPSVMVAREFAAQHEKWTHEGADLKAQLLALRDDDWLKDDDLRWSADAPPPKSPRQGPATDPWTFINGELEDLVAQMQDSRAAYLYESFAQADDIPRYFAHLLALDPNGKPWTAQLIRCGLAIGNVAYMYFKARCKRVRASLLCPGLVPPFGPPQHPSFPSGHSFLGHFIALLLLQIPGVAARYGVGIGGSGGPGKAPIWTDYRADKQLDGPLLWLAARLGKNRERMGLHYPSDTLGSRHLAGGVAAAILDPAVPQTIVLPTLQRVLARAQAEWR
jgi:membrane-associated phospholipid phosphatase